MAKKKGETRGGTRGGRGGARGGRFFLSKTQRRKSNRKLKLQDNTRDVPELMDLSQDVYVAETGIEMPKESMKNFPKRPIRRMMDEARYTDRNVELTMKLPLRKRPIEFVKAKELYDPSKDLIEKLASNHNDKSLSEHLESLKVEDLTMTQELPEIDIAVAENVQQNCNENESIVRNPEVSEEKTINHCDNNDAKDENESTKETKVDELTEKLRNDHKEAPKETDCTEIREEIQEFKKEGLLEEDIKKLDFDVKNDEEMIASPKANIIDHPARMTPTSEFGSGESDFDQDDMYFIDEEGENDFLEVHNVEKKRFFDVISQRPEKKETSSEKIRAEQPKAFLEHDSHITVGHVILKTDLVDGSTEAVLPTLNHLNDVSTKGFADLMPDHSGISSEGSDEEAAFEDYMAQLMYENNISESESDYDSDSNFDSGDDEKDNQLLNSEEEGLEDIINFARRQKSFAGLDLPATRTIRKKGKGKKQAPQFLPDLDMELREELLEQFHYQRLSRRDKKIRKKERNKQMALANYDLSLKYDYSLHIEEIKDEFDQFLQDESRGTMSFPPLDIHGNKTINKLSHYYNMRCTKQGGNGLSAFMKVSKTRKTFHSLPDHNLISYIMSQRPVFKRSDLKSRTKNEIAETDGKKLRRGPRSEAHVREGDIVGAKAPEIASNNIGRQLLEKLGWIKGEGLGPQGKKGISEPLMATVKKSKTGLK